MKKRKGQALIIVVIIIAIIIAVFANSYTTRLRYHTQEETEIYQREQALYIAGIGVNQMIFNINNGTTYNDGDSITNNVSGIGTYATTYHTPDDSGYGGSAYIESVGTVGEISRKVFVSVQLGGSSDAFKYCLYTSTGGRDGIADDSYFNNSFYGNPFLYNKSQAVTPYPDPNYYNKNYSEKYKDLSKKGNNPKYKVESGDLGKVIYIETKDNATLTIDFEKISQTSFNLSIITNAKNVTIKNLYPRGTSSTITWSGAKNSKDNDSVYPVITHLGTDTTTFEFNNYYNATLKLNGFIYTAGDLYMNYDLLGIIPVSKGEFDGEVIEKDPQNKLGGDDGTRTTMNYVTDYYTNPPPHFIVPGSVTKVLPGSFREEY